MKTARNQKAALDEIDKAALLLCEAEKVFMRAVGLLADAIHDARVAGVPVAAIGAHAEANQNMHALARGHVLMLMSNEARRLVLEAAAAEAAVTHA